MSGGSIPAGALPEAIVIILFSIVCFLGSFSMSIILTFCVQAGRYDYTHLIAVFLSLSTLASVLQQIHFAARFVECKSALLVRTPEVLAEFPALSFIGVEQPFQIATYVIENWVYNVVSLLTMFWAMTLFVGIWNIKVKRFAGFGPQFEWAAKIFSFVAPAITQGCLRIPAVLRSVPAYLILNNIILSSSLLLGSLCLCLTLFRYIGNRKRLRQAERSYDASADTRATRMKEKKRRHDEQWLMVRFTIGFFCLAAWEGCQIIYQAVQYGKSTDELHSALGPSLLTTAAAKTDVLVYIPGVSASLVFWIVFGTTAPIRRIYADFFRHIWHTITSYARPSRNRDHAGAINLESQNHDRDQDHDTSDDAHSKTAGTFIMSKPIVATSLLSPPPPTPPPKPYPSSQNHKIKIKNPSEVELTLWPLPASPTHDHNDEPDIWSASRSRVVR